MSKLAPASIGIDIGCYTSKIAVAKRGGVECITNQANFRQTPNVVGFGPAQRNIGEAGSIKMKSNFKDTVIAPNRFLGLPAQYPMLRAETKYCPARSNTSSGKIIFQVNYQGEKEQLVPEQLAAAYFNKIRTIIAINGFENSEAVVAVPSYLTQAERKAYLDAAKIAELNITRLINDSSAIALDYGMFRKAELSNQNPRNVLFIDFGHSKFSVFCCSFTKDQMSVVEQSFSRNLGCRDIDYHLFEFYRGVFEKSSGGSDIAENKKAQVKILEYIQKQRKVLTGNREHQMNIEYLMDECDLSYTMKRQQFEQISAPIINQISNILKKVGNNLKEKKINLHSIELIGGGTRIPFLLNIVKDVFNIEPSRTLNSSESVSRGCALIAAIKSPLFKVQQYGLVQKCNYNVKFYWNFVQGDKYLGLDSSLYPEKQSNMIFPEGCKVPTSKTIKFTRKEPIQILLEYEPFVNGFNKHIGYYVTKPQNPKEESFSVSFKLRHNEHGIITFEDCHLIQQWTEETKVPKKKTQKKQEKKKQEPKQGDVQKMEVEQPAKPEQEEFEIKKSKKQKHSPIKFEANTFDVNTAKDIQHYFTIECTMMNQDKLLLQTYERKNQLESISYQWKEKLTGSHRPYCKPENIPVIVAYLEQVSNWLYADGQNANRGTYVEKINSVKEHIDPIQKRYENFENIGFQMSSLAECLKFNLNFLNSLEQKYAHITPEQRQEVINLIERVKSWAFHSENKQAGLPKWEEPCITVAQIQKQQKQVNDKTKALMNKPAPKPAQPQKSEKAADEKKEQTAPQGQKMDEQNANGQKK